MSCSSFGSFSVSLQAALGAFVNTADSHQNWEFGPDESLVSISLIGSGRSSRTFDIRQNIAVRPLARLFAEAPGPASCSAQRNRAQESLKLSPPSVGASSLLLYFRS